MKWVCDDSGSGTIKASGIVRYFNIHTTFHSSIERYKYRCMQAYIIPAVEHSSVATVRRERETEKNEWEEQSLDLW